MNLLIASDIHGSARYCRKLLEAFRREGAERLLLLGDLLYHGPRNDLPADYAPKEVAALLNEQKEHIFGVRGNCDAEIDQDMLDFPILSESCLLYAGDRLIFATHGDHFHKDRLPPLHSGDILLHGHTHVPAWEELPGGILYCNPGSVSLPKEGSERGYLLLTEKTLLWKTLDGSVYHRMDL